MKVNLLNSRIILGICIGYTALFLLQYILEALQIQVSIYVYYGKVILLQVAYVAILVYFSRVLQVSGEKPFVRSAFTVYLIFDVLYLAYKSVLMSQIVNLPPYLYANNTLAMLGIVSMLVRIYFIAGIFMIKHTTLGNYYRLLAYSIILVITVKILIRITLPGLDLLHVHQIFAAAEMLSPLALIVIAWTMIRYLQKNEINMADQSV